MLHGPAFLLEYKEMQIIRFRISYYFTLNLDKHFWKAGQIKCLDEHLRSIKQIILLAVIIYLVAVVKPLRNPVFGLLTDPHDQPRFM